MLAMFNNYGMSHVCAQDVFENLETYAGGIAETKVLGSYNFNFPFLDARYTFDNLSYEMLDTNSINMEFYFRGYNPAKSTEYKNLFELLLFAETHKIGGNFLFCLSKLFGKNESDIYDDFLHLRELVEVEEAFVDRTQLPNYEFRRFVNDKNEIWNDWNIGIYPQS